MFDFQGSGLVEIMVGIVAVAGMSTKCYATRIWPLELRKPCITLERSQDINFAGSHFDAEQSSRSSCGHQEVALNNESFCAVVAVVCIHGGEMVFTVRFKEDKAPTRARLLRHHSQSSLQEGARFNVFWVGILYT
ncbi:hypothetical protein MRX96_058578 [Rhipicephalus microplus]